MSDWFQLATLAMIQGLTEFLPVSSSAHLILIPLLTGWEDQGLSMDISVHFGTLIAVMLYFRQDLKHMIIDSCLALKGQKLTPYTHLAIQLVLATIPVCIAGLLLHDLIALHARSMTVIGTTTILFGLLLWASIKHANPDRKVVNYKQAMWMGFAQVLALIPGTSRSGITLTAALFLGLSKQTAARFAFLMAIPVIISATGYESIKLMSQPMKQSWLHLGFSAAVSALFALLCIHYFLKLIDKIGLLPFVIYRLCLGTFLFAMVTLA